MSDELTPLHARGRRVAASLDATGDHPELCQRLLKLVDLDTLSTEQTDQVVRLLNRIDAADGVKP